MRWMIAMGILHGTTTSPPTHEEVARWVSLATNDMKGMEIIKNA
jgi:hypothetical protein